MKSDIFAELGNHAASTESLDRAIELEPLRVSTREKALNRASKKLVYSEYLSEFDALLAEDPDDKRLLFGRATAIQDGPDGLAYELAAREAIHWFPREPGTYHQLGGWYEAQERADLTEQLLSEAKQMLPEVFDKEDTDDSATTQTDTALTETESLPSEKDELLDLIWSGSDKRRPAALSCLLQMEAGGHLSWYQRSRLLSCRLLFPDLPSDRSVDAISILPDHAPGAAHWFVGAVCNQITSFEPPINVATSVADWLERLVPNFKQYPELWFERVLLLEHASQMEKALADLESLIQEYPANSSALYRMGIVKYRQEDFQTAQGFFERALEVNPGLFGAMDMLNALHQTLGDPHAALERTLQLRKKMPFSIAYLREESLAVQKLESTEAAEKLLANGVQGFPESQICLLRARAFI